MKVAEVRAPPASLTRANAASGTRRGARSDRPSNHPARRFRRPRARMTIDPAVLAPPPPSSLPSQPPPPAAGRASGAPPHVAFGQTSSDPRVTFAQRTAFDTFASILGAAAGLNRARNAYDAARPLPLPRESGRSAPPAGDAALHYAAAAARTSRTRAPRTPPPRSSAPRASSPSPRSTAGSARAPSAARPCRTSAFARATASRPSPDFDRVPAHIPTQDMLGASGPRGELPERPVRSVQLGVHPRARPRGRAPPALPQAPPPPLPVHADECLGLTSTSGC